MEKSQKKLYKQKYIVHFGEEIGSGAYARVYVE